jgi:hypothetical protein
MTRWAIYLRLGRVSNLPTVWSNTLAGTVLAGGLPWSVTTLALSATMSLFYLGGMLLTDACDRKIDGRVRPERPIPSGQIEAREVFAVGFGLLAVGVALCAALGGLACAAGGLTLAGLIVLYDAWHKGNPASPLVMGLCRVMVYAVAGLATSTTPDPRLWAGAAALLGYLFGLTYVAKHENRGTVARNWPLALLAVPVVQALAEPERLQALPFAAALLLWEVRCVAILRTRRPGCIPRAVIGLIAGISLLDATLIATAGAPDLAVLAGLGFFVTLLLQRWVKGT